MTLKKRLLDSLYARKQYIENFYKGENQSIALFEVETLIKIVEKHSSGLETNIKKPKFTRKKSGVKNKGFFN